VGDIESQPFLESARQVRQDIGRNNVFFLHVSLVPYIGPSQELKTKPTQHSVKEMREIGIQPDMLLCRCDRLLSRGMKEKIALFSNVPVDCVISAVDVACIYELPLALHAEGVDEKITELLNMWCRQPDLAPWHRVVERFTKPQKGSVKIGVVGKYVHLRDSYKSLHEALVHGGMENDVKLDLEYIDSEHILQRGAGESLGHLDAILVPGGFGDRGTEGKIEAIRYARESKVPFFGICLGMQLAVVEFARHISGMTGANSAEFAPDAPYLVIDLMPDQRGVLEKGGTMRLGAFPCVLEKGTLAAQAYGSTSISERHRHRFEVSNKHREKLVEDGLVLSGLSPDKRLVEMIELKDHPYFVGCQFHPEFKSRPQGAHPLFARFVRAALERKAERGREERAPSDPLRAVN
jgi:CTP synthase